MQCEKEIDAYRISTASPSIILLIDAGGHMFVRLYSISFDALRSFSRLSVKAQNLSHHHAIRTSSASFEQ